jgi:hypothetical protein
MLQGHEAIHVRMQQRASDCSLGEPIGSHVTSIQPKQIRQNTLVKEFPDVLDMTKKKLLGRRLDDGGWIKFALTIVPILWGFYQFFSQQNEDHAKILETYFSSLQSLENDVLRYVLSSEKGALTDKEQKEDKERREEAAKVIQSLAIAKTLIALESLDPVRKGKVIEYLHNSKLISKSHSNYNSSNLLEKETSTNKKKYMCKKHLRFSLTLMLSCAFLKCLKKI